MFYKRNPQRLPVEKGGRVIFHLFHSYKKEGKAIHIANFPRFMSDNNMIKAIFIQGYKCKICGKKKTKLMDFYIYEEKEVLSILQFLNEVEK